MTLSRTLKAAVLAAGFGAIATTGLSTGAQAQTTIIQEETGSIDDGYAIAPEQETIIRRRIIEERLAPVEMQGGSVRVGSIVPDYVDLQPMEGIGSRRLAQLAYFVSPDEKIVVVEPRSRQVVKIIDQQR